MEVLKVDKKNFAMKEGVKAQYHNLDHNIYVRIFVDSAPSYYKLRKNCCIINQVSCLISSLLLKIQKQNTQTLQLIN